MSPTPPEPDSTDEASASDPFDRFRTAGPMSEEAMADWDAQAQPGTPG